MPRLDNAMKLDFKDVLIRPKRSTMRSRSEVQMIRPFKFRHSKREWSGVPIMAANMDTTGTFAMAEAFAKEKLTVCLHKHYQPDDIINFAKPNGVLRTDDVLSRIAVSAGTSQSDWKKVARVLKEVPQITMICLDVANGYQEYFVACVKKYRAQWPNHTIIAGNVVTGEMVEELILSGADLVKVGIGPGSVCTTRKVTGVGYPQLSCILECADAAHGLNGHIVADGGCGNSGDIAKAFGAGADFVMAGGMFAGHDESGGELVERDGRTYKSFYGMSSSTAMQKHAGGVAAYRASEGKCVEVPYRGPVEATIMDILGGVRSACTYVGALKLKELSKRTTFIRVGQQLNPVFNRVKDATKNRKHSVDWTSKPSRESVIKMHLKPKTSVDGKVRVMNSVDPGNNPSGMQGRVEESCRRGGIRTFTIELINCEAGNYSVLYKTSSEWQSIVKLEFTCLAQTSSFSWVTLEQGAIEFSVNNGRGVTQLQTVDPFFAVTNGTTTTITSSTTTATAVKSAVKSTSPKKKSTKKNSIKKVRRGSKKNQS